MFVRRKKTRLKNGSTQTYAYLVENQWNPFRKKVCQKQIACLGNIVNLPDNSFIEKIILALDRFAKEQGFSSLSEGIIFNNLANEDKLDKTYDWGSLILTSHLVKSLFLTSIITSFKKEDKDKEICLKKVLSAVTVLLAYQLQGNSSVSERQTHLWYKNRVFLANKKVLSKNDFYRTLDFLIKYKDEIEKGYYYQNSDLFSQGLDLVLFDTTSIYYWGEKGEAGSKIKIDPDNALLRYGFSKQHRSDLKQLIVGVLMTEDGIPIAHETFPGNQVDLVSFPEIITKVKKKYNIKRIIFIADKGTVSEENLRQLEDENTTEGQKFEYILGVRIRKLPPALKKTLILNIQKEDMKKIKDNLYSREFKIKDFLRQGKKGRQIIKELVEVIYKNLDYYRSHTGEEKKDKENIKQRILKRRYFVCLNPFVAQDKQEKRKFFRKVIANKIKYQQNKQWIIKNGYKKYLKIKDLDLELDEERLNQEKYYDGKWILITNNQTMSPALAVFRYKSLSLIEQGFKDLKSLIKLGPIFHFKDQRIKAHVFVSFLTLILKWYVCRKLDSVSRTTGYRFIEKINNLKAIAVDEKTPVLVRTAIDKATIKNLKLLKMKIPSKVIIDRRRRPKAPPRRAGRPKKQANPNQQSLPQ